MATLSLGSMVVQLDLDGADFVRNTKQAQQVLGQTRETVDRTSTAFRANRTAARFASEGISELTGLSGRLIFGFEQMVEKALSARGAFLLLGQAAAVIGGVILVAGVVQAVEEYIRLGETVSQTIERIKTEVEEQKKFAAARQAAASSARALAKDQIEVETELATIRATAAGDELGMAQVTVAGKLKLLEIERRQRADTIVASVTSEQGQSVQLVALAKLTADKRRVIEQAFFLQVQEIRKANFIKETSALIENLQAQLKARQDFDQAVQAAATRQQVGGTILTAFGKAEDLRKDAATLAAGFQDLVQRGIPVRDLFPEIASASAALKLRLDALREEFAESPAALDLFERQLRGIDFGDFIQLAQGGRDALGQVDATTRALGDQLVVLKDRLAKDLPAGVDAAVPEIQKLTASMAQLQAQVNGATGSVVNLIANLAAAGQAQAAVAAGATE